MSNKTFLTRVSNANTSEHNGYTIVQCENDVTNKCRIILFFEKNNDLSYIIIDTTINDNKYLTDMRSSIQNNKDSNLVKTYFIRGDFSLCEVIQKKTFVTIAVQYILKDTSFKPISKEEDMIRFGFFEQYELEKEKVTESLQDENTFVVPISNPESNRESSSIGVTGKVPFPASCRRSGWADSDDEDSDNEDDTVLLSENELKNIEDLSKSTEYLTERPETPYGWSPIQKGKSFSDAAKKNLNLKNFVENSVKESDLSSKQKAQLKKVIEALEKMISSTTSEKDGYIVFKGLNEDQYLNDSFLWIRKLIESYPSYNELLTLSLSFNDPKNPNFKDGFWNVGKEKKLAHVYQLVNDHFLKKNRRYRLQQDGGSVTCCKVIFV